MDTEIHSNTQFQPLCSVNSSTIFKELWKKKKCLVPSHRVMSWPTKKTSQWMSKKRYSANGWKLGDCGFLVLQIWIRALLLGGDNERLSLCDNSHSFQKLKDNIWIKKCQYFKTKTLFWAQKLQGLLRNWNLIFVVPCIMLNSEIIPTRCNNCVYSSQWLYSTCFGWQFHPSSGLQCCIWPFR